MVEPRVRNFVTKATKLLSIRSATVGDAADLLRYRQELVAEECWLPELPGDLKLTEGDEVAWVQHHVGKPGRLLLVAEVDGRIAGVLHCDTSAFQRSAHHAELSMSVARDYREQGIGDALMRVFIDWAEENEDIEKISLNVLANNERALKLFRKMKFTCQGTKRREVKLGCGNYLDMLYYERFVQSAPCSERRVRGRVRTRASA